MYRLKSNRTDPIEKAFCEESDEKQRKSVYLPASVWKAIDEIAERNDTSRNEVFTKLLQGELEDLDIGDSSGR
jgi:hypothetical protein